MGTEFKLELKPPDFQLGALFMKRHVPFTSVIHLQRWRRGVSFPPDPCWLRKWSLIFDSCLLLFGKIKLSQLAVAFSVCLQNKSPHSLVTISESIPLQVSARGYLERSWPGLSIRNCNLSRKTLGVFSYSIFPSELCLMFNIEFLLPRYLLLQKHL